MIETILTGKTPDIGEENIKKLMTMFPEVVTEGKVDFEKLKQVLGEYVDDSNERFNFTWNGKGLALRLSQTPSLGTLRPCKEESKNWDTTQNLYIEGDNLEVLKLLQKCYYGKVKMIYIDPPYNTGKDFVYKDDFHDNLENYKRITGQVDGNGKPISTNTETSGRYHTDWLNMMYPRLRLARNLLADDGVIFISIDDNEVENLKKICNEIFGESNFIGCFLWKKKSTSTNVANALVSPQVDYQLCYGKKVSPQSLNRRETTTNQREYPFEDENGKYRTTIIEKKDSGDYARETMKYPILGIYPRDGKRWQIGEKTAREYERANRFLIDNGIVKLKIYEKDDKSTFSANPTLLVDLGSTDSANKETNVELFGREELFPNPKPTKLLLHLLKMGTNNDSIVLDFFSGSATTAHAVMQLNAEDGGNRRFIMVQLPEPTEENSEAYKAGYKNICEIGIERIRRAGEKIKEEYKDKEGIENLDIGFKVFKLDTSNIRKWQPDYDNLEQSLMDYVDNFVEGRTEFDVVYEIMLKYGLDLTYPVDEFTIAGKKVYSIGYGMLMICLDNEITTEVAKGIIAKIKELSPESSRVVFKDNGFKSDSNKTNIKEILKSGGIEEFITI
jgi:adenine-specific DNA-methyltransferase